MQKAPTTFPASYGSYALLRVLSAEGDGPVYLAAVSGEMKPWVIKAMPRVGQGVVDLALLKAEVKNLARMRHSHLAVVQRADGIESAGGFAMEYVRGRSLAALCRRAEEYSLLLPPELGAVVAHDAFAAAEYFHAFDDAGRVHGNLSLRTILVGYTGDVTVTGYRPGARHATGMDRHVSADLKTLAGLLYDLPFRMFPRELTQLVPRLLEDTISPVEAMAAVRSFLHDQVPSADQRRGVAAWLEELFPDHRQEDHEDQRLLAAGTQLLAPSPLRPAAKRISFFGGTTAMLVLAGVGALLMSQRGPGRAHSQAKQVEPGPTMAPALALAGALPPPEPPPPTLPAPVPAPSTDPTTVSASHPQPQSDTPDGRPSKPRSDESPVSRLLRAADEAFDAGKRIEAVHLGLQALKAGGGLRAHLALGEYYRSMHRYQEAMNHYRLAAEIEPENKLAATGVKMLESKLSPCQ